MKSFSGNVLVVYVDRDREDTCKYKIILITRDKEVYEASGADKKGYEAILENIDLDSMNFKRLGTAEIYGLEAKISNIHSDVLCRLIKCEVGKGISELFAFNDDNYMMLASYGAVRNVPVNAEERNFVQSIKNELARFSELIN